MSNLTITICGCGNGAHACAALMSLKGHRVSLYSPLAEEIERFRAAYRENGGLTMRFGAGLLSGLEELNPQALEAVETHEGIRLDAISSDAARVIPRASIVFVITPSFAHRSILKAIRPYLAHNSLLVFLPSRSGLEFEMRALLPGARAMAFQTLPWATRISEFGKEVFISARKKSILAAALPSDLSEVFFCQMESLLEMEIVRVRHIFTLTLSNVGQIIHPGIMYSIFKKAPRARYPADALPLFYQGIDPEGGERLERMSEEIRAIAAAAADLNPDIEVDKVPRIRDWLLASYGGQIEDTTSVYRMFLTNRAYAGLRAPVRKDGEGTYIPDFSTRYIVEDIPYGLLVTKSIGMMVGIETPTIDEVLLGIDGWTGNDYMGRLDKVKSISGRSRLPEIYGFNDLRDIIGL